MDEIEVFKSNMSLRSTKHGNTLVSNESNLWFIHHDPPCWDFNREIFHPGAHPERPDGAILLRVDDDFWVVGSLPYRFLNVPLERIVSLFYPEVKSPIFKPDTFYKD